MTGIIDNKKIAELVIKQNANEYEKINPETIATIVEDVTKTESGAVDATVQKHIDDKSIHLSAKDIETLTEDNLKVENIKAGNNITITREEDTNNLTINAGDIPTDKFLTGEDIIPDDATITITPIPDSNKFNIHANIPDVSKFVEQGNIRAGNKNIEVVLDPESNDVTLYGKSSAYNAGTGIRIDNDLNIINTMPDQVIELQEGNNITITGEYPEFTITADDKVKIPNWKPSTKYIEEDFCVYLNSLFQCTITHTSEAAFDTSKWKLIAGWSSNRQIFDINTETNTIELSSMIANKDALIVNIGGVLQQSTNYSLEPDGQTLKFINPIPANSCVEVLVMSNVVLDTYEDKVNIKDWKANTSYIVGNICLYKDGIYKCINKHISSDNFDKENWKLLCGYVKNSYFFTSKEPLTEIELPESVFQLSDITINVGNVILQSNEYTLDESGKIITFKKPIKANTSVEVTVFNNAILKHSEIPTPVEDNMMLVSNGEIGAYNLVSKDKILEILKLKTLANISTNANKIVSVNGNGSDYSFLSKEQLSADVKVRNIVQGYNTKVLQFNKENDGTQDSRTTYEKLEFTSGSVISNDGLIMIRNDNKNYIKNPNLPFERGNDKGCMIGGGEEQWEQPIMTSNTTPYGTIITSADQTDREGWRAMDGLKQLGNGWLVQGTSAVWEYKLPYEFIVRSFDFYNQVSGIENHSKDIDVWVNTPDNIVASFTAVNEDYGHSHVDIENPQRGTVFGLTIKNSYGIGVGMNEIKFNAKYVASFSSNSYIYVYAISNEDGTMNDIATSYYNEEQFKGFLPIGFTKYALIKTFYINNEWDIEQINPNKDIKTAYIDGSINGVVFDNALVEYKYLEAEKRSCKIVEQWGDTIPTNGKITFPQSYTKLFYVMANGEKILTKDNKGFTLSASTNNSVSWIAKGII